MITHRQLMSDPNCLKGPGDFDPPEPKEPPEGFKICGYCKGEGCSNCRGKGLTKKCKSCDGTGTDPNSNDGEDCLVCQGSGVME